MTDPDQYSLSTLLPAQRPSKRRRSPLVPVAIAVLVLVVAGLAVVIVMLMNQDQDPAPAGGSGSANQSTPAAAQPQEKAEPQTAEAAKAAAQRAFDRFSAGDYAGSWDLYDKKGKDAISRDDYVRLNQMCPPLAAGIVFDVSDVRLESPTTAVVVVKALNLATGSYTMRYEAGHWLLEPRAPALVGYAKGVDAYVAELKADDRCGDGK